MERKNINRGYKKLEVWNDAIDLYVLAVKQFSKLPFVHQKSASNAIDAAQSISRNIAEGYCRKSLKEYLSFLNYSLASCGELHSCYFSFHKAGVIANEIFEEMEQQHYKTENKLLKLIESLQKKLKTGNWDDTFAKE
ncbi:MAG: four helix bundle protein [Chitinophagales bacterium]|nr:four helix bundle protein [Chitinophagales bacterium]